MTDIFSLKDFSFPKGFLWGSATAGHQIEGNNIHSNNWNTEQEWLKKDPKAEVSGMACNHYNMVEEDVDLIKSLGHQAFRLSVEWSRIQPEEGVFDKEATEHYDRELALLTDAILQNRDLRADETLQKHAGWAEELKTRHAFTPENAEEILRQEVGAVFMQVLEDAGVYKCTPEGRRAFLRFVQSV